MKIRNKTKKMMSQLRNLSFKINYSNNKIWTNHKKIRKLGKKRKSPKSTY